MSEINDLLETMDVEALFDHFGLDYRKTSSGSDLQLRECPACKDDRWRTYFSIEKRRGICFHAGCAARFNLFSFTKAHLGANPAGTIRFFEDYGVRHLGVVRKPTLRHEAPVGWELPASTPLPTEEGMTHPYLISRKVLPATQALFGLRWCESGRFDYEDIHGRGKHMDFSQRIVLPISDLQGVIQTFVARDATGTAALRYLFPPTLPGAGRYIYGAHLALGKAHLVLGEGSFDAIAIHQAISGHPDFRDAAAGGSFGLSIGHSDQTGGDQLGQLRVMRAAGLTRLTIMWDGEQNALREALKAAEVVSRSIAGLDIRVALLPKGVDPAEVDSRVVRDAIDKAQPFSLAMKARLTLISPYK